MRACWRSAQAHFLQLDFPSESFHGVYGGDGHEGVVDDDVHDPPRFFSWRTDEQIQRYTRECFEIVDFHVVEADDLSFQSLTLHRSLADE